MWFQELRISGRTWNFQTEVYRKTKDCGQCGYKAVCGLRCKVQTVSGFPGTTPGELKSAQQDPPGVSTRGGHIPNIEGAVLGGKLQILYLNISLGIGGKLLLPHKTILFKFPKPTCEKSFQHVLSVLPVINDYSHNIPSYFIN